MKSPANASVTATDFVTSRLSINWRSQDLIDMLPAAVYICDAEAVVVAYNRRAGELWGREPVPGDTDQKYCGAHRLYRTDGTYLPHAETPMEAVLRTGQPARNMEVVIERPDGSRITVLVNIAPLFGDGGALVGAVNCFQDLTAQKQAEQDRTRLAAELHQAKKIEALGQLTAGVAHDFNNLLTAILGNLELLQNRTTDETSRRWLDNAARAAGRGVRLNTQLLGFARKQMLLPEAIDLDQLLAGINDLLHTSMGDAIRIEAQVQPDTWPALVDPNQIALVVLNLAINARDAMPGGGTLTIETRNATFGAADCPDDLAPGDYVALSIGDTGTGMSEEVRAMAFDPFFTTKGESGGSGLGLSTVLGVVTQSGGGVRINSELGTGTSIEIFLPRATTAASIQGVETERPSTEAVGGKVVLIVDDDTDVREVTAAMLESLGYGVVEANSGVAAIAILASGEPIDLMLVDIAMPGMDGIETARCARQQWPDLPVLFATGYSEAVQPSESDISENSTIRKPYRRVELHRKVQASLRSTR